MKKKYRRTPRGYDETNITTHQVRELLPYVLARVDESFKDRPDLVLAAWPMIIGPKLAIMTEAVSFQDGILLVKIKNSSLHSLLSQHEKPRIFSALRQRFPHVEFKSLHFRIG